MMIASTSKNNLVLIAYTGEKREKKILPLTTFCNLILQVHLQTMDFTRKTDLFFQDFKLQFIWIS